MMIQRQCTNCFKALGVASRMEIYSFLANNKIATVNEIVHHMNLTQPTISYHLMEMKRNGILKSNKKGKEVFYSINEKCPHFEKDCVLAAIEFSQKNNEE